MTSKYKYWGIVLLGIAISMYFLEYLIGRIEISDTFLKQNLTSFIWIMLIGIFMIKIPKNHTLGHIRYRENIYLWAMFLGLIMLGLKITVGIISGFGKNAYDLSVRGILNNLLLFVPPLIGRELIRSYAIGAFCSKKNIKALIAISLLFAGLAINTNAFIGLQGIAQYTICISENVIAVICENILLSYLTLYGGVISTLIYSGILLAFELFLPIQPDINWLAGATIGIAVPISSIMFIVEHYEIMSRTKKVTHEKPENLVSLLITAVICVGVIWFSMGVFPVYPSVVATGSMEPLIMPGDIILVDRIQEESELYKLKEGDIIQFSRDDIVIVHRIIEIVEDKEGNRTFRTKGDNNSAEDARLVQLAEVKGTLYQVIPKLGLPTLWLRGSGESDRDDIEF